MSNAGIFVVGLGISLICLVGLVVSVLEMRRLGNGGGARDVSMAIDSGRRRAASARGGEAAG